MAGWGGQKHAGSQDWAGPGCSQGCHVGWMPKGRQGPRGEAQQPLLCDCLQGRNHDWSAGRATVSAWTPRVNDCQLVGQRGWVCGHCTQGCMRHCGGLHTHRRSGTCGHAHMTDTRTPYRIPPLMYGRKGHLPPSTHCTLAAPEQRQGGEREEHTASTGVRVTLANYESALPLHTDRPCLGGSASASRAPGHGRRPGQPCCLAPPAASDARSWRKGCDPPRAASCLSCLSGAVAVEGAQSVRKHVAFVSGGVGALVGGSVGRAAAL